MTLRLKLSKTLIFNVKFDMVGVVSSFCEGVMSGVVLKKRFEWVGGFALFGPLRGFGFIGAKNKYNVNSVITMSN